MKKCNIIFALFTIFMGHFSVAQHLVPKKNLTLLEKTFINLFTPVVQKANYKKMIIHEDFEFTKYIGGVNSENGQINFIFGSDFKSVYPTLSEDGYAMILCHELGHILGETPEHLQADKKLSPEAESDYFAASICAKKLFSQPALVTGFVPTSNEALLSCQAQYTTLHDVHLCARIIEASYNLYSEIHFSLLRIMPDIKSQKFYAIPDYTSVDQNFYDFYPSLQCRFQTSIAGALCKPQMWEPLNYNWACTTKTAQRPACWYKN